jgi:ATP-dependent exoDNAse (exonuclease V) beta subunit
VEVFRERREQVGGVLALTQNYRSRPEVLEVINHLFAADFGETFQPLEAAGRFPDPAFGPAVELLVTDKTSYAETGVHWRKAEAQHIARRLRDLVDAGEADPGEIVLLFAAGTDARIYEEELRSLGLPTFRATGRDYYHQQQVVDLLNYLRLLHNRYDDEALVGVLASPFVGVSNDALVLLRRNAPKRPLYCGLEKELPEGLSERDARLFQAFRQRYGRLAAQASSLSLERLCEQIVAEHDYDLAVLARWDGRRRYANLRKLARLARSYEELRGPDVQGFVRFVAEQGAVGARGADAATPIGWVLDRLEATELEEADASVEIERGGARVLVRFDRFSPDPPVVEAAAVAEQLELFEISENGGGALQAPELAPLAEIPAPPLHRVRRLSYSALSLFERCSYRYFAERIVGLRPADASGSVPGRTGLAATEIGDAVHALLERVDLGAPAVPDDLEEVVRARYPAVTEEELERIRGFVASYCGSELGARIASLEGAAPELPFAFEHDGVLLHGRIDVLHRDGTRALVLDYKTNSLAEAEAEPEGIVESDYRLQRLVYALACFRASAEEVEVVYHFLERPDAVVSATFTPADVPALESELSAAIDRIQANDFRPTPDEFVCSDCPALNLVCAGPRLRQSG